MNRENIFDFLHLQVIVVILSFTAVIGKFITLPADALVWWRLIFAVIGLVFYAVVRRKSFRMKRQEVISYLLIGGVVSMHWLAFFGAIKLSNISVTLVVMSSTTLFTSLFEPLFLRQKFNLLQFIFGIVIILGISIIFTFELVYAWGILVALVSAILAALFTVLNKKYADKKRAEVVSCYELIGGWIVLTLFMLIFGSSELLWQIPQNMDLFWVIFLGVVCTSYAFSANVKVMRSLSAYVVSLSINMEPIYGIVLAYLFFAESEKMTYEFYIGTVIVLAAVISYPLISGALKRQRSSAV